MRMRACTHPHTHAVTVALTLNAPATAGASQVMPPPPQLEGPGQPWATMQPEAGPGRSSGAVSGASGQLPPPSDLSLGLGQLTVLLCPFGICPHCPPVSPWHMSSLSSCVPLAYVLTVLLCPFGICPHCPPVSLWHMSSLSSCVPLAYVLTVLLCPFGICCSTMQPHRSRLLVPNRLTPCLRASVLPGPKPHTLRACVRSCRCCCSLRSWPQSSSRPSCSSIPSPSVQVGERPLL